MATRYSDKTKQEVVAFVQKFDEENGRGGQSAAKKKFKINPISIKKWCVDQGYVSGPSKKKKTTAVKAKTGAKRGPKKGAKRKPRAAAAATTTAAAAKRAAAPVKAGSVTATLNKMSAISEKIESLQGEFEALKKSL